MNDRVYEALFIRNDSYLSFSFISELRDRSLIMHRNKMRVFFFFNFILDIYTRTHTIADDESLDLSLA